MINAYNLVGIIRKAPRTWEFDLDRAQKLRLEWCCLRDILSSFFACARDSGASAAATSLLALENRILSSRRRKGHTQSRALHKYNMYSSRRRVKVGHG